MGYLLLKGNHTPPPQVGVDKGEGDHKKEWKFPDFLRRRHIRHDFLLQHINRFLS